MGKLGVCQSCNATAARYSCPRCHFPSCSLACSSAHKTKLDCTGVALPIHAVTIQANDYTWGNLMRDQSYISSVSRVAEEKGRLLAGEKLVPMGRGGGGEGRLDDRSDKEDGFVRQARSEGVEVVLVSKGMSRRIKNSSRWDPKEKRMEWCTDVVFQAGPHHNAASPTASTSASTITSTNFPSTTPIWKVLRAVMETKTRKAKGKEVSPEETEWRASQRAWVETFAEHDKPLDIAPESTNMTNAVAENTTPVPASASDIPSASPEVPSSPSPFTILLAHHSIPSRADFGSETLSTLHAPASPSRKYLLLTPTFTLRESLVGTILLEYPTMELWASPTWHEALNSGSVEVVPRSQLPVSLPVDSTEDGTRGGSWERGRGRGRGGSRGGARGRGGFDSGNSMGRGRADTRSGGGVGNAWQTGTAADSGWGKRAAPRLDLEADGAEVDSERERETKRAKVDVEPSLEVSRDDAGPAVQVRPRFDLPAKPSTSVISRETEHLPSTSDGGLSLVDYTSE